MKKAILTALLLFTAASLFAQNTHTLDTVCKSLASHPNTTGDFTLSKTIQTNGRKLKSTGKYIISPIGILWNTEKPVSTSIILTKNSVVQIAANGNKSVLSGNDNQIFTGISETLSSVLSGDAAALRRNFTCSFTVNEKGEWTMSLKPKDSTIAAVMNELTLSGSYNEYAVMTSLVMAEASGNLLSYEFENQKFPEELSADEKKIFVLE